MTSIPRVLRSAGLVVRDAARAVRRAPSHAAMVIGVLAVGITAGTVTFSVVDAVLLKPLPIAGGDRLVFISSFDLEARTNELALGGSWYLNGHRFKVQATEVALFGSSIADAEHAVYLQLDASF